MTVGLSVEKYHNIIRRFFKAVDLNVPFEPPSQAVLDGAYSRLKAIPGWKESDNRCIRVGYGAVRLMVPYLCDEAQVEVTIFYTLGIIMDDEPLRYIDGITFDGGHLRKTDHVGYHYAGAIFEAIERLCKWYDPFIVSTIWKAFFQWMMFLPHETHQADALASVRSVRFIDYMRQLTTVADSTSCVVFTRDMEWGEYIHVIPLMAVFVSEVNDLLSSYKELIVGQETCSVMIQRQKLWKQPIEQVVQTSCDICIEIIRSIYSAPASPELQERLRQWVAGYVQFYLEVDRYRLKELLFGESRGEF
jgi:hypothetical protein